MSAVLEPFRQLFDSDASLGMSEEARAILRHMLEIETQYNEPASRQKENITQEFYRLVAKWDEETQYISSISQVCMNIAYQQIIGMGKVAIPLILTEMNKKPAHWFWALKAITRFDPVPAQYKGNIEKMTEYWLKWGRAQGYAF